MRDDLLSAFLEQELCGSVKEMLAAAVKESQRSGGKIAIKNFEFNCFDVVLDFEHDTATLEDVLSSGAGGEQIIPLPFFLEVCGLS
ncbi:hypothetical protein N5D48_26125 [Pseudomonas sp. GD03858]|uniref:hypothetical protein n=1 Tax=unclassified Pseudomonas TaxID=196821 RepID=UPI00244947D9|nr:MULTISPECIES: hypothetical protein [unclassified Pseudomonas]MDH0650331.1 hypothetical protein [Pseudomonas sp. GD03867]MDH0665884.1 hypothetical protein [Pseudomonas sp. GD03858]